MAFEIIIPQKYTTRVSEESVSIRRNKIVLSKATQATLQVSTYKYVRLAFDRANRKVAIMRGAQKSKGAYKVCCNGCVTSGPLTRELRSLIGEGDHLHLEPEYMQVQGVQAAVITIPE